GRVPISERAPRNWRNPVQPTLRTKRRWLVAPSRDRILSTKERCDMAVNAPVPPPLVRNQGCRGVHDVLETRPACTAGRSEFSAGAGRGGRPGHCRLRPLLQSVSARRRDLVAHKYPSRDGTEAASLLRGA